MFKTDCLVDVHTFPPPVYSENIEWGGENIGRSSLGQTLFNSETNCPGGSFITLFKVKTGWLWNTHT